MAVYRLPAQDRDVAECLALSRRSEDSIASKTNWPVKDSGSTTRVDLDSDYYGKEVWVDVAPQWDVDER